MTIGLALLAFGVGMGVGLFWILLIGLIVFLSKKIIYYRKLKKKKFVFFFFG